ncbi:MAG TPA: PAS domain-containing protein [Bryobacteraceae bacterium]|nr:PAS domain-containing protein [Bryobacteraceae bacterium]
METVEAQRREPRYSYTGLVDVFEVGQTHGRRMPGMLKDVSESGACVRLDEPIPVGSELLLKAREFEVRAIVRNVSPDAMLFAIGLEFLEGLKWRPQIPALLPKAILHQVAPAAVAAAPRAATSSGKPPGSPDRVAVRKLLHLIASAHRTIKWTSLFGGERTEGGAGNSPEAGPDLSREYLDACEDCAVPMVVMDVTGKIEYGNEAFRARFVEGEHIATDLTPYIASEDLPSVAKSMVAATSNPAETVRLQLRARTPDGSPQYLDAYWKCSAATNRLILVLADTTELCAKVQASEVREAAIRTTYGAAGIATWKWDIARAEVEYSAEFRTMFGLPDEIRGESLDQWFNLIHCEDRQAMKDAAAQVLVEPYRLETCVRALRRDGSVAVIVCRGHAERDVNGKPIVVKGVHIDVTAHIAHPSASGRPAALSLPKDCVSAEELPSFKEVPACKG